MTTTAISAQGSKLEISGAAGAAKNITGIALGNPTIISCAGVSNGDVLTLAGIGGTVELNGLTVVARNVTAGTFAVDVDTTGGAAWTAGGTATPVTWVPIANVLNFKAFDGQAAELDATNLQSDAKEYLLGLQDYGHFTFDVHKDYSDAGQLALDAAKNASSTKSFRLTLPNGKTATFNAFVKNSPLDGSVDALIKSTGVTLRITGAVTMA